MLSLPISSTSECDQAIRNMSGVKGKDTKEKASTSPIRNKENRKLSIEIGLKKYLKWSYGKRLCILTSPLKTNTSRSRHIIQHRCLERWIHRQLPSLQRQLASSKPLAPRNILSSLTSSMNSRANRNRQSGNKIIQRGRWHLNSVASSKWIQQQWCMRYKLVLTKTITFLAQQKLCVKTSSSLLSS